MDKKIDKRYKKQEGRIDKVDELAKIFGNDYEVTAKEIVAYLSEPEFDYIFNEIIKKWG